MPWRASRRLLLGETSFAVVASALRAVSSRRAISRLGTESSTSSDAAAQVIFSTGGFTLVDLRRRRACLGVSVVAPVVVALAVSPAPLAVSDLPRTVDPCVRDVAQPSLVVAVRGG